MLYGGCGTSGPASDAAAVAGRFQAALAEREGSVACAQLSPVTASKLAQQEHRPCERAILDLNLPSAREVDSRSVYVTSASVALVGGSVLFLDEGPGGWEVSAAGCRPAGPALPYDCELEG
jgi:hypothetical protein